MRSATAAEAYQGEGGRWEVPAKPAAGLRPSSGMRPPACRPLLQQCKCVKSMKLLLILQTVWDGAWQRSVQVARRDA